MTLELSKVSFASDYMEGAHPVILQRLFETNLEKTAGYGCDEYSESARSKIRKACAAPAADIFFLVGGTQTNATVIDAMLRPYQGVIAARTGHISVHEAGAVESGGHKVLELEPENPVDGKLSAAQVAACLDGFWQDENHDHMVMPGMVYISQPTEYGTLYSLEELTALSRVCRKAGIPLYMDGARLAYALAFVMPSISEAQNAVRCSVRQSCSRSTTPFPTSLPSSNSTARLLPREGSPAFSSTHSLQTVCIMRSDAARS